MDKCTNTDPTQAVPRAAGKTQSAPRHKPQAAASDQPSGPESDTPYWVPHDSAWKQLPAGAKRAVRDLLQPAYRRLVIEANAGKRGQAPFVRSTRRAVPAKGACPLFPSLVHLIWLEILAQVQMCYAVADPDSIASEDAEGMVARHLELLTAKNSTSELLLKLRMVRETLARADRAAQATPAIQAAIATDPLLGIAPAAEGFEERESPFAPPEGTWSPKEP